MTIPTHYQRFTPQGLVDDEAITISTIAILQAAEELGVKVEVLPGTKIVQLEHNGQKKYFRYQISTETSDVGFYATDDKRVTNNLLRANGVQVCNGFGLNRTDPREYWQTVFESLSKPLVVKPSHGNKGSAITIGVTSYKQYEYAVEQAFEYLNHKDAGVIVEEMFEGKEYRVTVTRDKVLAVMNRVAANVDGDGVHTIAELIELKNREPGRGSDDTFALHTIDIDEEVHTTLGEQGLTIESIPAGDENITLRKVSNLSKGGDSYDVTDLAHPNIKEIALKAINAIPGLGLAGVDIMTKDVTTPQTEATYRVVEVNTSPGIYMHEFPYKGIPRNTQYEFIYLAFPELRP